MQYHYQVGLLVLFDIDKWFAPLNSGTVLIYDTQVLLLLLIVITFVQGMYTSISETSHVSMVYSVTFVL